MIGDTLFYNSPDPYMLEITPSFLMIIRNKIQTKDPIEEDEEEKLPGITNLTEIAQTEGYSIPFQEDDVEVKEGTTEDLMEAVRYGEEEVEE